MTSTQRYFEAILTIVLKKEPFRLQSFRPDLQEDPKLSLLNKNLIITNLQLKNKNEQNTFVSFKQQQKTNYNANNRFKGLFKCNLAPRCHRRLIFVSHYMFLTMLS